MKKIIIAAAIALSFGMGAAACNTGSGTRDSDNRHPTADKTTGTLNPAPAKKAEKKTPTLKPVSERKDLVAFKLADRSAYGISDVQVAYTVVNHSSKKSDYEWDWEITDPQGVRVADGSEYVTNVRPGQQAQDTDMTLADTAKGMTLKVTAFDRTPSF